MDWYVIHTKPRQELRALQNLEQQNYECYLPLLCTEKLRLGKLNIIDEPLFSRYLFIRLDTGQSSQSWSPIRSTKGVSSLLSFGMEPAKVSSHLIECIRTRERIQKNEPQKLFNPGERLIITDGPFTGIDAIYKMNDGESRAMLLIEILGKDTVITTATADLRKIG